MSNLETLAREYVDTLNGVPNGLGHFAHLYYGRADSLLGLMYRQHGEEAAQAAIALAVADRVKAIGSDPIDGRYLSAWYDTSGELE